VDPNRRDSFPGEGGIEIHWQCWLPEGEPQAAVVIAHGVSEHSDRYSHLAERLVREGYAAYALDHRGHGDSGGKRGVVDRLSKAVADVDTLVGIARDQHPGAEVVLLGHSMGGAIAVEYAIDRQDHIDALVLSAPAIDLDAASRFELVAARVLSAVAPGAGVFEVDAEGVSRDPKVVRDYVNDPRVFHGKLPARTISEIAQAVQTMPERIPRVGLPLLVMVGAADPIVPPSAARMVHELAGSEDKRLIEYPGLYHEILNEPEQDKVMDDLVAWLNQRSS
jgi:alpha-beta hydrolase superfamily lysophospholipase